MAVESGRPAAVFQELSSTIFVFEAVCSLGLEFPPEWCANIMEPLTDFGRTTSWLTFAGYILILRKGAMRNMFLLQHEFAGLLLALARIVVGVFLLTNLTRRDCHVRLPELMVEFLIDCILASAYASSQLPPLT